jgi:hypothetical protein
VRLTSRLGAWRMNPERRSSRVRPSVRPQHFQFQKACVVSVVDSPAPATKRPDRPPSIPSSWAQPPGSILTTFEQGHIVDRGRRKSHVHEGRGVYDPVMHHYRVDPAPEVAAAAAAKERPCR